MIIDMRVYTTNKEEERLWKLRKLFVKVEMNII